MSGDFRKAIEHAVGQPLRDDQQVTIQISEPSSADTLSLPTSSGSPLPEWCRVYEGLAPEQIAALEGVALQRANLSRSIE